MEIGAPRTQLHDTFSGPRGSRSRRGVGGEGAGSTGGACGLNVGIGISRSPTRSMSPILMACLLFPDVNLYLRVPLHDCKRRLAVGCHQLADDHPLGAPSFGAENIAPEAFDDAVDIAATDLGKRPRI